MSESQLSGTCTRPYICSTVEHLLVCWSVLTPGNGLVKWLLRMEVSTAYL